MTEAGHNSAIATGQLRALIERVERLEEEKAEVLEGIKEVYAEAKANGFDTKTMRKVVALRRKSSEERQEEAAMLELYLSALGMLAGTPLGRAAMSAAEAAKALGEPAELTDEEKAKGVFAAFVKDGTRMTLTLGGV